MTVRCCTVPFRWYCRAVLYRTFTPLVALSMAHELLLKRDSQGFVCIRLDFNWLIACILRQAPIYNIIFPLSHVFDGFAPVSSFPSYLFSVSVFRFSSISVKRLGQFSRFSLRYALVLITVHLGTCVVALRLLSAMIGVCTSLLYRIWP